MRTYNAKRRGNAMHRKTSLKSPKQTQKRQNVKNTLPIGKQITVEECGSVSSFPSFIVFPFESAHVKCPVILIYAVNVIPILR